MNTRDVALLAASGHHDDPRTWLSLLVAIDGAGTRINAAVDAFYRAHDADDVALLVARSCDGLDGLEVTRALRAALEQLFLIAEALE